MPETPVKKSKKGNKSSSRTKPSHMRYNSENHRDKNKAKSILRYMKKHPAYKCPESANKEVKNIVKLAMAKIKPQTA
jgi:hypothetical protein